MSSDCVECVLCRGLLPTSNDEQDILMNHMKEHHRVFVNIPFIISTCFLDQEGINETQALITRRTNSVINSDSDYSSSPEKVKTGGQCDRISVITQVSRGKEPAPPAPPAQSPVKSFPVGKGNKITEVSQSHFFNLNQTCQFFPSRALRRQFPQ